jgi:hypothetical protein
LLNKGKDITVRSIRNRMLGIGQEVIDPLKDRSLAAGYSCFRKVGIPKAERKAIAKAFKY